MAGKYAVVFLTQVKNMFEYKTNLALKLLRPLLMTFIVVSLWSVIFSVSGQEEIAGFTIYSFIIYLLIVRYLFSFSPGARSIGEMNDEIRKGDIIMRLVKPIHYLPWLFARNAPIPVISGSIGILLVTLLAYFLGVPFPTGLFIIVFLLSLLATILLHYSIALLIGILSFWIYEVFPVERIYKVITSILSGEIIPLTLFGSAQSILQLLPFAGVAFVPAGIFIRLFSLQEALFLVGVQFIWVVVFWGATFWLYHKGLKKFEGQGG